MNTIEINLYSDWILTVKQIFQGSGHPLPEAISDREAALAYFLQTVNSDEEAELQLVANEERFAMLQQIIMNNFETVIVPDIRSRTDYTGVHFTFKWIYNKGEHVVEQHSSYRIPL